MWFHRPRRDHANNSQTAGLSQAGSNRTNFTILSLDFKYFKFDDDFWFLRPIGDSDDEGSDSEENPECIQAEETAAKMCKKAGLPEIHLDALPSSLSTKFMKLRLNKSWVYIVD